MKVLIVLAACVLAAVAQQIPDVSSFTSVPTKCQECITQCSGGSSSSSSGSSSGGSSSGIPAIPNFAQLPTECQKCIGACGGTAGAGVIPSQIGSYIPAGIIPGQAAASTTAAPSSS